MKFQYPFLVPVAVLGLGVASCASVVDPGNEASTRGVAAPLIGDDCVTDAQCNAAGEICCGGFCLSRTNDNNCGACGNVCPGTTTCLENATCGCSDPATVRCGNNCVDTMFNKNHCGACGAACAAGRTCEGGACVCEDPALTACAGACVDVTSNNAHCGACGAACAGATTCLGGACGCADPALTQCGNACVNVLNNNTHCGACDTACTGATTCLEGVCGCANPALTQCGNACINVLTDNANCGACGTVCGAGQSCQAGECHVQCAPGKTNCNEVCVDLTWSPNHCGACDSPCDPGDPADPANFPPYVCGNSVCALTCPAGQTSCNRSCRNLQTDNTSCGTCGNVCAAGTTCTNGTCLYPIPPSCLGVKQRTPAAPSGVYTIDPDGGGPIAPFNVFCDQTGDGGGWTRVVNIRSNSVFHADQPNAVGDVSNPNAAAKLSDAMINMLTTLGYWRYNCGSSKNSFVRNTAGSWTSMKVNNRNWSMDNNRDGTFECPANRSGYVFSDHPACNAGHSNYAAAGGAGEGNGCYTTAQGWGLSGNLWVK